MVILIQVWRNITNNFIKENVLGRGGFAAISEVLVKIRRRNFGSRLGYFLEQKKILSISLNVARGVEHMHRQHSLTHQNFIHKDLKPSNILLGDEMKAKVSDFGLIRLNDGKGYTVETKLAGTFGYVASDYVVTSCVTTKSVVDTIFNFVDDQETLVRITTFIELANYYCVPEPHQLPNMGHAINVLSTRSRNGQILTW
ncbi:receptor protein kinase TMK1-like [Dendrobium catenatum]|uniref:receptor protein kinase TMK1-like n=1 Tax=Dendrobium catenatum TaxID=906689 RepID=UPI0009F28754|nr:receptor protein kinase TMK1-like [Dendrobium catenatum]